MKISGFTFVRNAVRFDYPVVESIRSILPLCDEFVVAVGNSSDETRGLIEGMGSPKIRILDTVWDENLRKGGEVLAAETDKAFDAVNPSHDWAFYLQADEVIHEQYLPVIQKCLEQNTGRSEIQGLLFDYLHFWGSYHYTGDSRQWYRNEIRVIRNDKKIRSYRDAQGFRREGRKLKVVPVNATVCHYGWVKPPAAQQAKQQSFHRYWHSDRWIEKKVSGSGEYDYSGMGYLAPFTGTHPMTMKDRIAAMDWEFTYDPARGKHSLKEDLLHRIEKITGWRPGEYKNYRL